MTLSVSRVRDLAVLKSDAHVLSVYVRTDPRDPANNAATPSWLIELRNEFRDLGQALHSDDVRQRGLDLQALCDRVEHEILGLTAKQRARGLARFLTAAGTLDDLFSLQLPPRRTLVRWDRHPYVSPLVDVVDRGRPTGLVLLSAEAVRLSHWSMGRVHEPERSVYELEPGQWRDYDAYVGHARPAGGGMHVATFSDRVADWRERFLDDAASAIAEQVTALDWDRLVLVGEARIAAAFADRLPAPVRDRVVATVDANLIREQQAAVAERLEPVLEDAWRRQTQALVDEAIRSAAAGAGAVVGWADVLDRLVRHQAGHVVVAAGAAPDPEQLDPQVTAALGMPSRRLIVERAVELAVASAAEFTVAPAGLTALADAGGAVATVRY